MIALFSEEGEDLFVGMKVPCQDFNFRQDGLLIQGNGLELDR